jgi:xylulokinase
LEGEPSYLLGVDLGTTACKAIVFDLQGRPQASAEAELEVRHPRPTWAVGDPESWWRTAAALIRKALAASGVEPSQIAAVGLCGLMHAPVLLDQEGRVVQEAMLWMDQRCRRECEWLRSEHGDRFRAVGGSPPATSTRAPKLLWLAKHRPDAMRRARRFLLPKDYLRFRLCGDWATDPGDASGTALLDRRSGEWSRPLVALVGLPAEALPPIRPSSEVRGRVSEQAAQECGLAAGTPVVCGSSDVQCTLLGANARRPGQLTLYLGTAGWLTYGQGEGKLKYLGFAATSAACLKWWREAFGDGSPSYDELTQQVQDSEPGAGGLLFFPHLMGERAPVADPRARGGFFGLTLAHRRADLLRAILEGVAYHLRHILEAGEAGDGELVAVGGGARSPLWLQTIADITGRGVRPAEVVEAAALGAAMLAGVGAGLFPSSEQASCRLVRVRDQLQPRAELGARYQELYQLWRPVDACLQQFYGYFPEEGEL